MPPSRRAKSPLVSSGGMSMKGGIYTKEHCPVCGGKFRNTGKDLICPEHLTRPKRCMIGIYNKVLHKHVYITSHPTLGKPFCSYEEADRLLTVIRNDIDGKNDFDASRYVSHRIQPFRFKTWADDWFDKRQKEMNLKRKAPSYLKALKGYIEVFKKFFEDMDIRDIGAKQIEEFYLSLKVSPKTTLNYMSALHKMFSDALKWKHITEIPDFPEFDIPEVEIQTIDLETQDRIIEVIPNRMDRTFVLFLARLMLRPCEPRALQWEDIDSKRHLVHIRRHYSLNEIRPATKSKNVKILPLSIELEEALRDLPRHLSSQFIFWKKDGKPYSESWVRKVWAKACKEIGVKVSLYQGTKHSSATDLADREGEVFAQQFMGHTSLKMAKRYIKVNPERLRKGLR